MMCDIVSYSVHFIILRRIDHYFYPATIIFLLHAVTIYLFTIFLTRVLFCYIKKHLPDCPLWVGPIFNIFSHTVSPIDRLLKIEVGVVWALGKSLIRYPIALL